MSSRSRPSRQTRRVRPAPQNVVVHQRHKLLGCGTCTEPADELCGGHKAGGRLFQSKGARHQTLGPAEMPTGIGRPSQCRLVQPEHLCGLIGDQPDLQSLAKEKIVAGVPGEGIRTRSADKAVLPFATRQVVVANIAKQGVIAVQPLDQVVAGQTVNGVSLCRSGERVIHRGRNGGRGNHNLKRGVVPRKRDLHTCPSRTKAVLLSVRTAAPVPIT